MVVKIFINEEPFEVFPYEDLDSILKRYAVQRKNTIPEFLRMKEGEMILEDGMRYTFLDFREEFKGLTLENINDSIESILFLYPDLNKSEVGIFAFYENSSSQKPQEKDISLLKLLDSRTFFNDREIEKLLKEYPEFLRRKVERLIDEINYQNKIIESLEKIEPITCCGKFDITEIQLLLSLDIEKGITLETIFDSLEVSDNLPFINLNRGKRNWHKVYQMSPVEPSWIYPEKPHHDDAIFFVVTNNICNKRGEPEPWDILGYWHENGIIEVIVEVESRACKSDIKDILFGAINGKINFTLLSEKQMKIKGTFNIENIIFNRAIFSDLINNNDLFSYFLFVSEGVVEGRFKSITEKIRFACYYEPQQNWTKHKALSITVTPNFSEESPNPYIEIRISKAQNMGQIEAFQYVFSRLLSKYLSDSERIIEEYEKLLSSSRNLFNRFTKKQKVDEKRSDRKTGKRLNDLKFRRPELFRSGYASMCQPMSHQPYILDESDVEKFRKEYGEHKLMEYKDNYTGQTDWYACEPRESGEPNTHIFPGLRRNNTKDVSYKNQAPLLPCCFSEDQYTKTASELRKFNSKTSRNEEGKSEFLGELTHILAPDKPVPSGRFGKVPYYIDFMIRSAGYSNIEKGKQSFLPVFRHGVIPSPDSFLHCLEHIFNFNSYSYLSDREKKDRISKVRKEMSEMNYAYGKQELYNYPNSQIKNILLDETAYLNPKEWVMLASLKYNCNIFLYDVDEINPNGNILIPESYQAYLQSDLSPERKSAFIICYPSNIMTYDRQCELLIKYSPNAKLKKRFNSIFHKDPLVSRAIELLYSSNSLFMVSVDKIYPYYPVRENSELFDGVSSQIIDGNGKVRVLNYENGISLVTSPLPPLNKPISEELNVCKIKEALKFVEKKNLTITLQDGDPESRLVQGFWVKSQKQKVDIYYGYIPVEIEVSKEKVEFAQIVLNDPYRTEPSSRLKIMRKSRKIADFLKQYVLFQYSLSPETFGEGSFIIIPEHEYNLEELDKRLIPGNEVMYKEGKIIVRSKETSKRLLNFLGIYLHNNYSEVHNYGKRVMVKDYYRTLNDFEQRPLQLVFINTKSLWNYMHETERSYLKTLISIRTFPFDIEVYFYKNYNIEKGRLLLLQNVLGGGIDNALSISYIWERDRINPGYYYEKILSSNSIDHYVYNELGRREFRKSKPRMSEKERLESIENKISVMRYDNGSYCAMLFI